MLIIQFMLGLVVLVLGAELFVRGASRLAALVGISPLIVGLTVVAFGTSAPEVAVSVQAGLEGQGGIALGNIIGSNISNLLLILGISAMVAPLMVSLRLIKLEVPLLLGISVLVFFLAVDRRISRLEGLLLLTGAVLYTVFLIWQYRRENPTGVSDDRVALTDYPSRLTPPGDTRRVWLQNILLLVVGLVSLVFGARWLVHGASGMARVLGVSELVIGLTVVAVGTSLPELATSIAAAMRGERDMAIGNVIGSNLFNLLLVMGSGAIVAPQGLPVPSSSISFDIPVMIAVTAASLPIFFSGYVISRWEGLLLFGYYGAYILYLLLFSVQHDLLPAYSTTMLRYILPLTALMLILVLAKAFWTHSRSKPVITSR
ncbi:MAG: calcium/sodium antiporter [Anaerolineales bacterium]|jgi:cation:H+ antiporter